MLVMLVSCFDDYADVDLQCWEEDLGHPEEGDVEDRIHAGDEVCTGKGKGVGVNFAVSGLGKHVS